MIPTFITSRIDFECNGLIITPNQDYNLAHCIGDECDTAQKKHEKISDIITDILKKKAVSINDDYLHEYRVKKMLTKKWNIHGESIDVVINVNADSKESDICLICHEPFYKNEYHLKHSSCSARYHPRCHIKMTENDSFKGKCPACNSDYNSDDYNLVESIKNINDENDPRKNNRLSLMIG
jgi:hypothetical protein